MSARNNKPQEQGFIPYIVEHVGAEDKRLVWLEDSYHVATLDNDKEAIAREILQFIQAH